MIKPEQINTLDNDSIIDQLHLILKKIEELDASKNDYITHEEYEAHAYKCLSNKGTLLVFTKGVRGGKYYEDDTFRLDKKLT